MDGWLSHTRACTLVNQDGKADATTNRGMPTQWSLERSKISTRLEKRLISRLNCSFRCGDWCWAFFCRAERLSAPEEVGTCSTTFCSKLRRNRVDDHAAVVVLLITGLEEVASILEWKTAQTLGILYVPIVCWLLFLLGEWDASHPES